MKKKISSKNDQLMEFNIIILSDAPGALLGLKRMEAIKQYVENGGSLWMVGGWESFTGSFGHYKNTPIEEILPVNCLTYDDRVNDSNGYKIVLQSKYRHHPILQGLPWNEAPTICGFNKVKPKKDSSVILTLKRIESIGKEKVERIQLASKEHPLLIVNSSKGGKTLALTTDIAPHWVGGMLDWGPRRIKRSDIEVGNYYVQFIYQVFKWLSNN